MKLCKVVMMVGRYLLTYVFVGRLRYDIIVNCNWVVTRWQ